MGTWTQFRPAGWLGEHPWVRELKRRTCYFHNVLLGLSNERGKELFSEHRQRTTRKRAREREREKILTINVSYCASNCYNPPPTPKTALINVLSGNSSTAPVYFW
jgi:hypothetical protein